MSDLNQLAAEMAQMTNRARNAARKVGKKRETTERGFAFFRWRDVYGQHCRLAKSSLASAACIWLGVTGQEMHLNQNQAAELAAALNHFAANGELP